MLPRKLLRTVLVEMVAMKSTKQLADPPMLTSALPPCTKQLADPPMLTSTPPPCTKQLADPLPLKSERQRKLPRS